MDEIGPEPPAMPEEAVRIEEGSQYLCVLPSMSYEALKATQECLDKAFGKYRIVVVSTDDPVSLYKIDNENTSSGR